MSNPAVLFVSHKVKECGVHDYGLNVFDAIRKSSKYRFTYVECDSPAELHTAITQHQPTVLIYNYHPSTLPWVTPALVRRYALPQVGTIHEVTQSIANKKDGSFFDFYVTPDPTLEQRNPLVFKTGRPLPAPVGHTTSPARITIGSFGFGTQGKGFDRILVKVQEEFDDAVIRLNIPFAKFGDSDGSRARQIANYCKSLIRKKGIELQLSHEFLDQNGVLDFLSRNTINLFLYKQMKHRGISSAIDYALAARRPLAISDASMFRHIYSEALSIDHNSLKAIIERGIQPLAKFYESWTHENLTREYELLLDTVLRSYSGHRPVFLTRLTSPLRRFVRNSREWQEFVTGWRLEPAYLCCYRLPKPPRSYSQFSEDTEFARFLGDQPGGVFIDVGANDGVHGSNSMLLEQKGWRGVLVEPIARLAQLCRDVRPHSIVVGKAAVGSPDVKEVELFEYFGELPTGENYDGLSSVGEPSILEAAAMAGGASVRKTRVPATTLNQMLAEHSAIGRVDFVSIDVEGLELDVLQGFSLEQHRPRLLLIEDNTMCEDGRVAEYLKRKAYFRVHRTGVNDWYVRQEDVGQFTGRRIILGFRLTAWRLKRSVSRWIRQLTRSGPTQPPPGPRSA